MPAPFPSADVASAFALHGAPARLPGGQGDAFVIGDAVLKFVDDPAEAEWTQDLLHRVNQDGFRCAQPLATTDGRWVHSSWIANAFVAGLRPVAPDWSGVVELGLRFCDAAEGARRSDEGVLGQRTHRWAVADRVAWEQERITLAGPAGQVLDEMLLGLAHQPRENQFIHGDLSGNVFVDADDIAVILDVSPYIRPRQWAAAIVFVDAFLWHGADSKLIRRFARDDDGSDLIRRALVFRFVADQLSDDPLPHSLVDSYRVALHALTNRLRD